MRFRAGLLLLGLVAPGCNYVRLLRPSVLQQLNPEVVALVEDGVMRETIRIPTGQFIWQPAIIVMPSSGELELEIVNDDAHSHHAAILPSNGDKQFLLLPSHTRAGAAARG